MKTKRLGHGRALAPSSGTVGSQQITNPTIVSTNVANSRYGDPMAPALRSERSCHSYANSMFGLGHIEQKQVELQQ
jgi:hypothetical protein